ncbi:MAG: carotenoid biosynthesis protein [Aggregatilineaceae bacterium]
MRTSEGALPRRRLVRRRQSLRWWGALLTVWLLVWIATPLAGWTWGDGTFPLLASLGVLAQVTVSLAALAQTWPVRRILRVAAIVLPGTWSVEAVGAATGVPFGHYDYTDALWPRLLGVPLLIPLAWLMMLPPAWAVATVLKPAITGWRARACYAAISGAAFTAWDFYLDPQMVARGLWVWEQPGGYWGIPWVNFAGWWLGATALTWLINPTNLPRRPLLVIYTLVWLFQAVGLGLLWDQPGPALVGLGGMGIWVLAAWWREWQAWRGH